MSNDKIATALIDLYEEKINRILREKDDMRIEINRLKREISALKKQINNDNSTPKEGDDS